MPGPGSEGSSLGSAGEREVEEVTAMLETNAALFGHNAGALIDLLKELVSERVTREEFRERYAKDIDSELPLPDQVLEKVWSSRRTVRDGPLRNAHFAFLGLRRVLTRDQAQAMQATPLDVVKEEVEDPGYEAAGGGAQPKRRRVRYEQYTCLCQRKFHGYVALVVHAGACEKLTRLPELSELPVGFLGKMRDTGLSAQQLQEAWNSTIPQAPPQDAQPPAMPQPPPGPPGGAPAPPSYGAFPQPAPPPFSQAHGFPQAGPQPPPPPPPLHQQPMGGYGPYGVPPGTPHQAHAPPPSPFGCGPPMGMGGMAQQGLDPYGQILHSVRRESELQASKTELCFQRLSSLEGRVAELLASMAGLHEKVDQVLAEAKPRTPPQPQEPTARRA